MKKILLPLLAGLVLMPSIALGASFMSGEEVYIDEPVSEDLYAGGGLVNVKNSIGGDLVAGGGRIYVDSRISQDVLMGAGDMTLSGEIGDDARIVAGSLTVDATIKGDLIAGGGDLTLTDQSFIGGDANMAGGSLMIEGTINGDLRAVGGSVYLNADVKGNVALANFDRITFGPNAKIQGSLWYRAKKELILPEGMVQGEVIFKQIPPSHVEENLPRIMAGFSLFSLLATLLFGLFLIWIWRYYILHVAGVAYESTLKSLGVGLLVLILTPILALVFLVTTIGLPISMTLMALWFIYLYIGKVTAAMLIGFKIVRVDEKSRFSRVFGSFALGALIFTLIGMVPVLGWVVNFLFVLIAIGANTLYGFELSEQLRKKKLA